MCVAACYSKTLCDMFICLYGLFAPLLIVDNGNDVVSLGYGQSRVRTMGLFGSLLGEAVWPRQRSETFDFGHLGSGSHA